MIIIFIFLNLAKNRPVPILHKLGLCCDQSPMKGKGKQQGSSKKFQNGVITEAHSSMNISVSRGDQKGKNQ